MHNHIQNKNIYRLYTDYTRIRRRMKFSLFLKFIEFQQEWKELTNITPLVNRFTNDINNSTKCGPTNRYLNI